MKYWKCLSGCGTSDVYYKLTDEEYEEWKDKKGSELSKLHYPDGIPEDIRMGYGWYGCRIGIAEDGTKYYTECTGNSCD